jgi:hypothetical protein
MFELINIITLVKLKITDESVMIYTAYQTAEKLRDELDAHILLLHCGKTNGLDDLNLLFSPTASLQEHSLSNNWATEYLQLSEKFDQLFNAMKGNQ